MALGDWYDIISRLVDELATLYCQQGSTDGKITPPLLLLKLPSGVLDPICMAAGY